MGNHHEAILDFDRAIDNDPEYALSHFHRGVSQLKLREYEEAIDLGQQVPESPFIEIGQLASVYYFAYFLVIIPLLGRFEKNLRF